MTYEDLYASYLEADGPRRWVQDMFGDEFEMTPQHGQFFDELGKLVSSKLSIARRENMIKQGLEPTPLTEEEKKYASKIGISIMSGQGVGKDAAAAIAVWYFLDVFTYPKILCTAPPGASLEDVVWPEVAKWRRKAMKIGDSDQTVLEEKFEMNSEKVYYRYARQPRQEWFAVKRTIATKTGPEAQAETLSGRHEDFMMFVIDEATGVPDPVFKPLEGSLTGICNIALMLFNPTRTRGFAINSHSGDAERWVCLRWNAEESPRVNKQHVQNMLDKYGRDSNPYRMRVLGLPPISDDFSLIPYEWIEDCINKEVQVPETYPLIAGMDFGAGGDKSVIFFRRGPAVYPPLRNTTRDSTLLTEWCRTHLVDKLADYAMGDSIGVGWAVLGNIRELLSGRCLVISVSNNSKADNEEKFANKRAESYWRLREAFERREISIPEDDDTIDQLSAIRYDYDTRGRLMIVKKADIKAALGNSPDESDALANTYARRVGLKYERKELDEEEKMELKRKRRMLYDTRHRWMTA